jgi:hypothetical protein
MAPPLPQMKFPVQDGAKEGIRKPKCPKAHLDTMTMTSLWNGTDSRSNSRPEGGGYTMQIKDRAVLSVAYHTIKRIT